MPSSFSLRWVAVSIFIISSSLNYLDRTLLSLLSPFILAEMHLSMTQYGYLISAFSVPYAVGSLATGWMLDRFGINRTITGAVSWWSIAAIGNGLARTFGGLTASRVALGFGESAGVPAVGKNNGIYLKPEERALGAAANQIGLSFAGVIGAFWVVYAAKHGWRAPFMINGFLGFLWIPIWLAVSRLIPARYRHSEFIDTKIAHRPAFTIFRERNLLLLMLANVLWMTGYSLWTNWITLYLVHVQHLTTQETAKYVWIPSLLSNAGGFFGGWLSLHWMRRNQTPLAARRKAVWVSAICSLSALLLPLAPNAGWATAGISLSYFFALSGSVNIYALPIDLYGPERSGLALAGLTCAFGLLQTVISPLIGKLGDHNLFSQVIWIATIPLLLSAFVLMGCRAPETASGQR